MKHNTAVEQAKHYSWLIPKLLRSSANIYAHLQRYQEKLSAIGISHARK